MTLGNNQSLPSQVGQAAMPADSPAKAHRALVQFLSDPCAAHYPALALGRFTTRKILAACEARGSVAIRGGKRRWCTDMAADR